MVFLCVLMGLHKSLIVLMDSNGSLWVLIEPYAFLRVLMDFYRSLCALTDSTGSLWDLIGLCSSI